MRRRRLLSGLVSDARGVRGASAQGEARADYEPPPATGTVFSDVPADAFAAAWIEELAAEGITAGCGGGLFCPDGIVLRAQAAALIVKTFGLS